jgi:hypothetical protein
MRVYSNWLRLSSKILRPLAGNLGWLRLPRHGRLDGGQSVVQLRDGRLVQREAHGHAVAVTDVEDGATPGTIPCASVTATSALGHDNHEHDGTPMLLFNLNYIDFTGAGVGY